MEDESRPSWLMTERLHHVGLRSGLPPRLADRSRSSEPHLIDADGVA